MNHPIVLVGFEPDWEALYVDGKKVAEGHHVEKSELFKAGAESVWLEDKYHCTVQLKTTHVEEDEADEYGEHTIPDTLEELAEQAPLAYRRIST